MAGRPAGSTLSLRESRTVLQGRQAAPNDGRLRVLLLAFWSQYALLAGFSAVLPLAAQAQESNPAETAPAAEAADERVILEADTVYELSEENSIVAEGNVQALYQGRTLRADRLVYNRTTEKVRANGNVVIIDTDGSQQYADEVEVGSNLSDGYAIGFSARLAQGASVAANSAIRRSDGVNSLDQVVYTSCEVCAEDRTPTWTIRARRAVLDQESQMISYRDAVVEVAGIPVFYLPYLAHPDPNSDRRSGLLIPNAGVSSKLGAFYKQPYYWAISDYSDLTIAPMVSANVNPLIGLEYRKRFYSGALKIDASFTQEADFDSEGVLFGEEKFRGHVYANGAFALSPEWLWGFAVESQTDDLYDRRYDIDGQTDKRGLYSNQPRRLLSQLFAVGQGDDYYADVALLNFQGLRGQDDASRLPVVSPLLYAEKNFDLGDYGFANVNVSSAVLTRDVGADSHRVSAGADWRDFNLLPGGATFEPFVEVRGDFYALDEAVSGKSDVSRAVGNAGAKIAYPMIRTGETVDLMIEPAVMAAWGFSNVNDPAIPVEDSQLYEFDESSLYDPNGFGNFDLYEGDGKLSAGLTARAIWKNGTELSTTVGRRWRSRPDAAFDVASNLDGTSSDWVASSTLDLGRALQLSGRVRLDDDDLALNRLDMRVSTSFSRFRAVGQYYKIDPRISPTGDPDEGIYLRGEMKMTDSISVIFGQLRDIADDIDARQEIGLAYTDDCSRFELVYSRNELRDRTLGPSENFQFRFTLKSLGNFGSGDFD
jgi:LPS-assembly protein